MDRWKYFDIVHEDLTFWNPLSEAKVEEWIGLLRLPPGARVLDVGCGRAELLLRLVERWGATGVGVDRSPLCAAGAREKAAARGLADRVEIVETDGAAYSAPDESFDLVICLGASWIWGGHAGTLAALAKWTKPGGMILAGEPYWRREPSPEHLGAAGYGRELFGSHEGNVGTGTAQGLRFLHSIVSNEDDWDRYEGLHCYSAERYAAANPGDPDVPELLEMARRSFDHYLAWGRAELGWATYLFLK